MKGTAPGGAAPFGFTDAAPGAAFFVQGVSPQSELLTKATCVPSGDHDGTLIVPWPPYT